MIGLFFRFLSETLPAIDQCQRCASFSLWLFLLLSLLLLIVSIGTLSIGLVLSLQKARHRLQIGKVLGIKDRDGRCVFLMQIGLVTLFSFLLSFIPLLCCQQPIKMLIGLFVRTITDALVDKVNIQNIETITVLPWYFPFLFFVLLFLLLVVFSLRTLRKSEAPLISDRKKEFGDD